MPHTPLVDMPPDEFRRHGYAVIDRLVDHFATLAERVPYPAATPLDIAPLFDVPVPENGEPLETILTDWETKILPNSSVQGSPRFFGWVNGGSSQVGALADALASGLNPNPGGWRAAQAATVIENQTIRWLADLMGLDASTSGLFVSGGTMANTAAIRMALTATATWDIIHDGLQSPDRPRCLTVYMADHESHASLTKAVDLLGLGRHAIRLVPSRSDFTIDPDALEAMLTTDIATGMTPFCLVGHAGSINVGAIDDLTAMADIAARHKIWFHVDGACGALGAMLPELRPRYAGMERADSVSFDAHKWMGVPYEAGCVMARNAAHLRQGFAVSASYLAEDDTSALEQFDFYDRGPQMSRGWRALKVWLSLRHYGAEGYRAFFRRTLDNAQYLHELVSAHPAWEVVQPSPTLYIYSFRFIGESASQASDLALDTLNAAIAEQIKLRGIALVMTTRIRGRVTQRLSIANHRTQREDILAVFEAMTRIGAELQSATPALDKLASVE